MALVYPFGSQIFTVAAGASITVSTMGSASVEQSASFPNFPVQFAKVGVVSNGVVTFGPFTSGALIKVEGGPAVTTVAVGTSPAILTRAAGRLQGDPVALNATGAVTAAMIFGGLVTSTTAAAVTGTLPTGTVLDAASDLAIGDAYDWSVINTGATNAFTVAAATGHTIVGSATVALSTSAQFRTRKTAAATYITYRIS